MQASFGSQNDSPFGPWRKEDALGAPVHVRLGRRHLLESGSVLFELTLPTSHCAQLAHWLYVTSCISSVEARPGCFLQLALLSGYCQGSLLPCATLVRLG